MNKHREITVRSLVALCLAAVMAVSILPVPADAATSGEIQKEIDALEEKNKAIQAQIDAVRSQYDANYNDMADIVNRKEAIDEEIALLTDKIETTNAQISAYSQLIADTQDELDAAEEELRTLSEQHRERIRAMEEGGNITYWQVIFEANSFTDLLDRLNMMQEISEADQRRLQEMRIASDIVTATRMSLESEKTELEGTWEELTAAEAELEEKRTESDDMLRELEKKSEEYQRLMDESEALQDELMQEIAAKEKDLKQAKYDEYLAKLALQGENRPPTPRGRPRYPAIPSPAPSEYAPTRSWAHRECTTALTWPAIRERPSTRPGRAPLRWLPIRPAARGTMSASTT